MEKVLWSIIAASALCVVSAHVKRQYHFVYDKKNQAEARSYCREKYTDLATIDDMEDMNILRNMVDLNKINYPEEGYGVWIGLYDDVDSWRWSMSDKSFYKHGETEFRNWVPGEPDNQHSNEPCTCMQYDGQWFDAGCNAPYKAVCMDVTVPVSQQVIKVKVKKSSSVDLNDPAVMEDILKQLKQRLKDQGVNENITLSWRKQPDGKIFHKDERRNRKDGEKEEL